MEILGAKASDHPIGLVQFLHVFFHTVVQRYLKNSGYPGYAKYSGSDSSSAWAQPEHWLQGFRMLN